MRLSIYFLSPVQLRRVIEWLGGHLASSWAEPTTAEYDEGL